MCPPPGDSRQEEVAAAAPLLTLQGWLGTAGESRVKGWQTDPGYGPPAPRLPASGGSEGSAHWEHFFWSLKAAQPIRPGQKVE